MIKIETHIELIDKVTGNKFVGSNTDIINFVNSEGGLMEAIKNELIPNKYKITIIINKL